MFSGSYEFSEADNGSLVLQVLSLSDRYMLPGLKRQCEAVLRSRLDEVTTNHTTFLFKRFVLIGFHQSCAISMLRAADIYNASYLSDACVSYIVDHFRALVNTEE